MAQPKLALSLEKLDKLADDVAKLDQPRMVQAEGKLVPSFQRDGFLEEANKKTLKWNRRFFVLRDSCLLSYDDANPEKIVEPETCICLGKCKVHILDNEEDLDKLVGKLIDCSGKKYCIHITTRPDKEHVLLCASSAEERQAWVDAIKVARTVTHANMVKLAVENRVLAEEKGAAHVTLNHSTSALAIFSNRDYIQKTPIAGGAEGWLRTVGFKNSDEEEKKGKIFGLFGQSELKKLKKRYCILKDSHLLLYDAGDALLKPRGVMYLVGTQVEMLEDESGSFRFRCSSDCGDYIDFIASSEKRRRRWVFALKIGARVTYPDFRLLMDEHALLANAVMTPRAGPTPDVAVDTVPIITLEDVDIQDKQVDPGAEQPHDDRGNPYLRNPQGRLVSVEGIEITPSTPRFSADGNPLDNFNRALPAGAVPMFTSDGVPIGVGPDGQHYLADGTIVKETDAHYDADGKLLPVPVVKAANAVATNLNVAIKVRARLASDRQQEEAVDVLGRTFRGGTEDKLVNADGDEVPLASARRINNSGEMVDFKRMDSKDEKPSTLIIKAEVGEDDEGQHIGTVEIRSTTTLADVRAIIQPEVAKDLPDFLFLFDMTPLLKYEESTQLAIHCLPEMTIRSRNLSSKPISGSFSKRVDELLREDDKKRREQEEFDEIMNRVRSGTFLKPVARNDFD